MRTRLLMAFLLTGLSSTIFGAVQTGQISGKVVEDTGLPISGATVYYYNLGPAGLASSHGNPASGAAVTVRSSVQSGADGGFLIADLPVGTYRLCAAGVTQTHLPTCQWTAAPIEMTVAQGQSVTGANFVVVNGTLLDFNVQDPGGLVVDLADLPTVNGRIPISGGNFEIGLFAGSRYARATLTSKAGAARHYQIAVPKHIALRLFLGTSLAVLGSNGSSIPQRQPSVLVSTNGEALLPIVLSVQ